MKSRLLSNSVAGALEQVVVGLGFLAFYGILIRTAGAEQVGVLSLILVLTAIGSFGNAGFASALSHFIPLFEARKDRAATVRCIETTILCTLLMYGAVLAIAYVPFEMLIRSQVGPGNAAIAGRLMAPTILYVMLLGIGAAASLALTALHRNDLRVWAAIGGVTTGLAVVVITAPTYGILAGAWALAAQTAVNLAITWIALERLLPELPIVPFRISRAMAKTLFGLGMNMQLQSILSATLEPVARLLIAQFAPLYLVTYFSMASRFVLQMRTLIYACTQPLLATFSHLRETDPPAFAALYERASRFATFASLVTMSATAGAAPFVGELWIGERTSSFTIYTAILAAGWAANATVLVSYFNSYSLGRMKWNLIGHVVMALSNLIAGAVLGIIFGASGAVAGLTLSLLISAVVFQIGNSRYGPSTRHSWLRTHGALAVFAGLAALLAALAYDWLRLKMGLPAILAGPGIGLIWLGTIMPIIAFHPVGREAWIRVRRLTRSERASEIGA